MFDVDFMSLLAREVLRERRPALVAETCAWTVGLSDQPHHLRLRGRVVSTGTTIGARAASGQPLSGEEDGRLELGDARPGSFQDVLNAVTADGTLYAERFDAEVVEPFVLDTCVQAVERARATRPAEWAELLDELGEDGGDTYEDLVSVIRAGEWEVPLRIDAEQQVLAALGDVPLIELEAEGLPLSLVRSAEAVARAAAPPSPPAATTRPAPADDLAGAVFLAESAVRAAGLPVPVVPADAAELLQALLTEGIEPEEVPRVVRALPVAEGTAEAVERLVRAAGSAG